MHRTWRRPQPEFAVANCMRGPGLCRRPGPGLCPLTGSAAGPVMDRRALCPAEKSTRTVPEYQSARCQSAQHRYGLQEASRAILDQRVAAVVVFSQHATVPSNASSDMPSTGEAHPLVLECRRGAGASSEIGEKGGASWLDHLTATTGPAHSTFRTSRRNSCAAIPPTGNNTPGSPA